MHRAILLVAMIMLTMGESPAAEKEGRILLERNCGRCHAVALDSPSPLAGAPNLRIVLGSYPTERLEFELAEGIGSRHREMPQVQFTLEDIEAIESYLAEP
jgi:mono/diheme cytochrome c family protein